MFISAAQKQMDQLDATADPSVNTEGLDFVQSDSRLDLLENKVTLAVPEGNPKGIDSFDSSRRSTGSVGDILLAMGNSDVPVGQYTQKILTHYGLDEAALANAGLHHLRHATSRKSPRRCVRAAWTAGIIYCDRRFQRGPDRLSMRRRAEMCGQVIYPAAVLKPPRIRRRRRRFWITCARDEADGRI